MMSRSRQQIGQNSSSLAARIIVALLLRGSTEVDSKTNKYRVFTVVGQPGRYYFVGPQGAWRVGRCASQSISLERATPKLLAWYAAKVQQQPQTVTMHCGCGQTWQEDRATSPVTITTCPNCKMELVMPQQPADQPQPTVEVQPC